MAKEVGVMTPLFSLPGDYGIGDVDSLYRFVEILNGTGVSIVQLLPMNALMGAETSPYSSISAFALHPLYISLRRLPIRVEVPAGVSSEDRVDYQGAYAIKSEILRKGYAAFLLEGSKALLRRFEDFCQQEKEWLDEYALFHALAEHHKKAFWDWEESEQNPETAGIFEEEHPSEVNFWRWQQWVLFEQWQELKSFAHEKGIRFMGDLPLYVSRNSSDYWARPEIFKKGVHAGVPPDMYSEDGQDWGNPIYNWPVMKKRNFSWWKRRMEWLVKFFHLIRIDHIRGMYSYWEVPDGKLPKEVREWTPGPKKDVIDALKTSGIELIGEDLGDIPPEVDEWMEEIDVPGYRVLLFGWGSYQSEKYRWPEHYPVQSLACTSTHDSESFVQFLEMQTEEHLFEMASWLGFQKGDEFTLEDLRIGAIRKLLRSPSRYVILPLQDILGLGIRVNLPGSVGDENWSAVIPLGRTELDALDEFVAILKEERCVSGS